MKQCVTFIINLCLKTQVNYIVYKIRISSTRFIQISPLLFYTPTTTYLLRISTMTNYDYHKLDYQWLVGF